MGAGVGFIKSPLSLQSPSQLFTHTLWAYLQLYDDKPEGRGRLAVMRADTERRYFFREMTIKHRDRLRPTPMVVRMADCQFPERGVYFIEFWYDEDWLIDQRLDVV